MTLFAPAGFKPPKHGVQLARKPRIYDLRLGQCHYPTGFDEGEHRFCAAPVERWGAPYCVEHHAMCNGARHADAGR